MVKILTGNGQTIETAIRNLRRYVNDAEGQRDWKAGEYSTWAMNTVEGALRNLAKQVYVTS